MESNNFKDLGLLLVRLAFGFRLIYGTIDNVVSYERMLEFRDFLEGHSFPFPLVSAFASVYLQFLAGLLWVVGYRIRVAATVMALNFIVALVIVHTGDTYLGAAPAIHLLVVSVLLATSGAGRYALDHRLS